MNNAINLYAAEKGISEIKLNLGSGGRPLKEFINIDNYDYENNDSSRSGSIYDIKMDIRSLDCLDSSIHTILLVHVIEHFTRWETIRMLKHYYAKLAIGGLLMVEMPDLDKCIEWYLKGKDAPHMQTPIGVMNMGLTQFYGNQWDELDYETHRYVWRLQEFTGIIQELQFEVLIANWDAKFHKAGRDMFVVGRK